MGSNKVNTCPICGNQAVVHHSLGEGEVTGMWTERWFCAFCKDRGRDGLFELPINPTLPQIPVAHDKDTIEFETLVRKYEEDL
jgi:hypothetical protein